MALFDKAWATKTGGAFVLRIEDTDQNRLVAGSEQQIHDTLAWLGLSPDEGPLEGGEFGPYRQSERLETYRPFVEQLIADGHAYHCWCSSERLAELRKEQDATKAARTGYDRLCLGKTREERAKLPGFTETPVVRMLVPDDAPLTFTDIIRGEVKAPFPDDQVILKADGFPTYHMAVVVDDHLMGITTVVRGEEWISSTPKHLLLYRWLGFPEPQYAHMPLLRNTDRSKISKRRNPAARLMWFREQGYLPEAVRNFLQLLGYPPADDDSEVATFEDFVENFSWDKVNTTGPVFDVKKLDWLNGHYIRALGADELTERIVAFHTERGDWDAAIDIDVLRRAVPLVSERMTLLGDALPKLGFLFTDRVEIEEAARASLPGNAAEVLDAGIKVLETVSFDAASIQAGLREKLVGGLGIKPKFAFGPLRVGLTGAKVSPPLFESMEILGREETLKRVRALRETL
ncbi:glutamate--tRNA ligase [Arachnia propionica]|uniref:glutamate--tRNA ligase n=1 Tax=Arachnia propionica TaxID=1750 RepID=UPI00201281FF